MPGISERLVKFSEEEAARLIRLYAIAEAEIINEINKALLKGNKIEYLQTMLRNVQQILYELRQGSRQWSEEAIPDVYQKSVDFIDEQVAQVETKAAIGFGAIHQQAVQILAENAYQRFEDVAQVIGRQANDIYRQIALESIRGSVVGYQTWKQVANNIRDRLAEHGVTGFKDKTGRQWNMRTYAEMVARTTTMQAHLEGTANRLLEHGRDLVKVSNHKNECEKCRPWEGKILSLTGKTEGYPTVAEAKAKGLFHPRCRHAYGLYVPELE